MYCPKQSLAGTLKNKTFLKHRRCIVQKEENEKSLKLLLYWFEGMELFDNFTYDIENVCDSFGVDESRIHI